MKKLKKYILLVLMSLCSMASYAADFEVDGIDYKITSMSNLEIEVAWRNYDYSGNITIPEHVYYNNKQYTVVGIGNNCFEHYTHPDYDVNPRIAITLPNTIRYIGDSAFQNTFITDIELPTSLETIGSNAFAYSSLNGIIIPENVTTIGTFAFYRCESLNYAVIGKRVTSIGNYAFGGCRRLNEVFYLGDKIINTAAFIDCSSSLEKYLVRNYIKFDKAEFRYNGIEPSTNWENSLKQLECNLIFPELPKDAGEHEVICKVNFSGSVDFVCDIPYTYTINKAPLTITANNKSKTYGDDNPTFDATFSGFVNNENKGVLSKCELSTTATASSDAGTYPITILADAKNYDITAVNGTLTINKAPLTATVVSSEKVYGDENPAFAVTYSGLKNNDTNPNTIKTFSYTTEANKLSDVGSYSVTASNGEFKNYEVTKYNAGILTVKKAPLSVSCNDATKVYGDANPTFSFTYSGFKNNDTVDNAFTLKPSVDTDITRRTDVGEHDIIGSNGVSKNYALNYVKGKLTITKAPLLITANNATREYGSANPTFTFKYEGFKNEDTEAVLNNAPIATSVGRISDVGEYNIASDGATATNYNITYGIGKLTITKALLEVKVNDASRLYGENNPEFSLSYSGFKNDDDVSCLTTKPAVVTDATEKSPTGTYALSASGGSAKNYDFKKYTNGTLTIGKSGLKVSADIIHMTYGNAVPTLTYTCSGLKNNDTNASAFTNAPSLSCAVTSTSDCGEYPIQISNGTSNNYEITYVDGKMVVDKRDLVALVGKYTRPYNTENPQFKIEYSGFVNNDNESKISTKPTISCSATKSSDTGEYEITLYGGNANNYSFIYVNGNLTIEKAEQEIVWEDQYGHLSLGDQVELTAKASSGLDIEYSVSDESVAKLYTVGKNRIFLDCLKEGTVIIKAKQPGDNNYYSAVTVSKTITIGNASGIENVNYNLDSTTKMYNINGQRVSNNSKGIVIINGKKYLKK